MKTSLLFSCLAVVCAATSVAAERPERVKPSDIRPERELLITDPAIVDSERAKYPGPWSFGTLVEELVGKEQASEAIHQWLECYYWNSRVGAPMPERLPVGTIGPVDRITNMVRQVTMGTCISTVASTVDPLVIPARPNVAAKFIRQWQDRDGYDQKSGLQWKPNLANAPFRLLAIVNRMDLAAPGMVDVRTSIESRWKLRGKDEEFKRLVNLTTNGTPFGDSSTSGFNGGGYNGGTPEQTEDFGEGRLIFGAVGTDGRPLEGGWTLIFEYKLKNLDKVRQPTVSDRRTKRKSEAEESAARLGARDWARAWHWLGALELKDPRYAEGLEKITRAFTHRRSDGVSEAAVPQAPNFGQLRSSEASFGPGREFRQFQLQNNRFIPAALPMTPAVQYTADTHEGGRALASFLHQIEPLILAGIHSLPPNLPVGNKVRPLLAGHAIIPDGEREFHWEPKPRISRDARRIFSVSTCNGCHAADTGCPDGLHVHPRETGFAAATSAFLRMDGKENRFQDPGVKASYVRQQEMEDRAIILAALLESKDSKRLEALADTLQERLRRGH